MPSKQPDPRSRRPRTCEALLDELLELGKVAEAEGDKPRFELREAVSSAKAIADLARREAALGKRLARAGVNGAFVDAGLRLARAAEDELAAAPPDSRRYELATDLQRKLVTDAVSALQRARRSAADAAIGLRDTRAATLLGRGLHFHNHSLPEVRDAVHQFLSVAAEHMRIIDEAQICEDGLDVLRDYLAQLDSILDERGVRRQERSAHLRQLSAYALALESYFHLYRARVRTAVGDDPVATTRALSVLPRSPERRHV